MKKIWNLTNFRKKEMKNYFPEKFKKFKIKKSKNPKNIEEIYSRNLTIFRKEKLKIISRKNLKNAKKKQKSEKCRRNLFQEFHIVFDFKFVLGLFGEFSEKTFVSRKHFRMIFLFW